MIFIKKKYIISTLFTIRDCFYEYKINETYNLFGINGIYSLFLDNRLILLEGKGHKHYINDKHIFAEKHINDIILRNFRDIYLHRRLIKFIREKINIYKYTEVNVCDLLYNDFYDINGIKIIDFIKLYFNNTYFKFSKKDIENIFITSLQNRDGLIYDPIIPKNPYNGLELNIYELTVMYVFLKKHSRKNNEIIDLFRYSAFNIDVFKLVYNDYLKHLTSKNYVKELDTESLLLELNYCFTIYKKVVGVFRIFLHYQFVKDIFIIRLLLLE